MPDIDLAALAGQAGQVITGWGLRVVGAVAVLVIGRMVARRARGAIARQLGHREVDPTLIPFLSGLAYWLAIALVLIAVFGLFGIPTASFVAVLGAAGLAIGLALQGTLSNFAAGVMLLIFRPFRVGDVVEAAGATGKVAEIGIFSTTLDTPDNVRVIIPNGQAFGSVIRNFTGNERRRVDLIIGVSYDDDLDLAMRTMMETVRGWPGVLEEPEPVVAVHELADSSVNFVVRPWCATADYWTVRWGLTGAIKTRLEAAGCSIPYPQRDVHIMQDGAAA